MKTRFTIGNNVKMNVYTLLNDKAKELHEQGKSIKELYQMGLAAFKEARHVSNIVTNAGKTAVAKRMGGITQNAFTYIALGSGTNAPVDTDTALQTEITTNGGARALATASLATTTETDDTLVLSKEFTFSGPLTISEIGIFSASSAGDMLSRLLTGTISVDNLDVIEFFWMGDIS